MTMKLDACGRCQQPRPSEALPRAWIVLDAVDRVLICPQCWRAAKRQSPVLVEFDRVLVEGYTARSPGA